MIFHFLILDSLICVNAIVGGWETIKNRLFMTKFHDKFLDRKRKLYDRNSIGKRTLALTDLFKFAISRVDKCWIDSSRPCILFVWRCFDINKLGPYQCILCIIDQKPTNTIRRTQYCHHWRHRTMVCVIFSVVLICLLFLQDNRSKTVDPSALQSE